jgi:hypothetical protein
MLSLLFFFAFVAFLFLAGTDADQRLVARLYLSMQLAKLFKLLHTTTKKGDK